MSYTSLHYVLMCVPHCLGIANGGDDIIVVVVVVINCISCVQGVMFSCALTHASLGVFGVTWTC